MSNPSRLPGCQWSSYISKVGPLHNWTSLLTMQGIPDQSHCQLNSVARGGDRAIQPIGINHKATNLAILSYQIDLNTTYSVEY